MILARQPAAFLGVDRSLTGRRWQPRLDPAGEALAESLMLQAGKGSVMARVLASRGVTVPELPLFLKPRLRDLMPDPSVLRDMDAAVARLMQAIRTRETVAIFGDYDVDGACSAALLAGFLRACGLDPAIHIPDRLTEGYGPNAEAIATLRRDGATLLVTVDCGTTSHEVLEEAGLDCIVLDHHQAPPLLPAVQGLVNPNRQDDVSGLGALCAAGVVFMTLVALNRALREAGFWSASRPAPDLMGELDLVALATVADVSPLTGLNRAFVRQGLEIARARKRLGLNALIDVSGLDGPVEPWHFGFLIGPRINAGGRIGEAWQGARLLLERDEIEAKRLAAELDTLNRARQEIERLAVEEATAMAERQLAATPERTALVVQAAEWHPGIVGLVASRLKERFRRPAFAFALNADGKATGSGRSVTGIDLGLAVRKVVEQGGALKGGGHAMAAGVTVQADAVEAFHLALEQALAASAGVLAEADRLKIDAALTAAGARTELLNELAEAGPYGAAAPEPVFAFPSHRIAEAAVVGAGGHVRFRLRGGDGAQLGGIVFRAADEPIGQALLNRKGQLVHAVGTLSIDRWGGGERVQLRLIDLAAVEGGG